MSNEKSRAFGPDLVRAAAVVLVLSVHFFLHSGFYDLPLQGLDMGLNSMIRMAFMTCVPLFLMLTGYLCIDRPWSKGYYRKLLRVLLCYFFAGVCCAAFRILWLGDTFVSWKSILPPYGWSIEMYIGLFLLIPFLNAMWHGSGGPGRTALLLTMLALTSLPSTVNSFGKLLPSWWGDIYPLTYYFLGAWLRERPVKCRSRWLLLGWLGLAATAAAIVCSMAGGGVFSWSGLDDWPSLFVVGESICAFSIFIRCDGKGWPVWVRRSVSWLARVSLELYLLSYIGDSILYPYLTSAGLAPGRRLLWLPAIVTVNVLFSGVLAQLAHQAIEALMQLLPVKARDAGAVQCRDTKS